jgi:hypothetical protein
MMSHSPSRDLKAGPPEYVEAMLGLVQMVIGSFSTLRTIQKAWVHFRNSQVVKHI